MGIVIALLLALLVAYSFFREQCIKAYLSKKWREEAEAHISFDIARDLRYRGEEYVKERYGENYHERLDNAKKLLEKVYNEKKIK